MKKFIGIIFLIVFVVFGTNASFACTTDEIDVNGDGTQCESAKFTITTTELASNSEFRFALSARGTFYVDCGNGGTLSGDGVAGKTITRTGTKLDTYTCTYSTAGTKTIRFGGLATGYTPGLTAISFGASGTIQAPFYNFEYLTEINVNLDLSAEFVAGISGSLGAIFPTVYQPDEGVSEYGSNASPSFAGTFYKCTNLKGTIPNNLFQGVSKVVPMGFALTFAGCSQLSGNIPENLFRDMYAWAPTHWDHRYGKHFMYTFADCTELSGPIPENLFAGIGPCTFNMEFFGTFKNCTGLSGQIPENLFTGREECIVSGGLDVNLSFAETFAGCTGLSGPIPENLFATRVFTEGTHYGNFYRTFAGCTGLTGPLPAELFNNEILNIAHQDPYVFAETFDGCSGLTGPVPPELFPGLGRLVNECYEGECMSNIFRNTNLWTSCPCGEHYKQYITGLEEYWDGHVSCEYDAEYTCPITACDAGFTRLMAGDGQFALYNEKTTTPAVNIGFPNGDVCYIPLDTGVGGTGTLNFQYDNVTYHANPVTE